LKQFVYEKWDWCYAMTSPSITIWIFCIMCLYFFLCR